MIKQCLQCNSDFEENTHTGQEQKYCSATCRYRAANSRRENKIKEEAINSINNETTKHQVNYTRQNDDGYNAVNSIPLQNNTLLDRPSTFRESNINTNDSYERRRDFVTQENNGVSNHYIGVLEKYYDTRSENKFLMSELIREKEKVRQLEKDLEEDEEEEEDYSNENVKAFQDYLNVFTDKFREDPLTMVTMFSSLLPPIISGVSDKIASVFKPKTA